MTQSGSLPLIGAALRVNKLPHFIDWLAADQRDLEIQDPCYPAYLDGDWRADAAKCRARLDAAGYQGRLGIHAVFGGIDLSTWDGKLRAAMRERLQESLEFGALIGATHAVIHSPFQWFGSPLVYFSSENVVNFYIAMVHELIDPLLPTLEQMDCAFVIETIADANPHALIALVKSFNSPRVRLSIDTGHVTIMERFGGAPPDHWVMQASDLLGHVHLQDTDGHGDRHWALGEGRIGWKPFFNALQFTGANPRLVLELAQPSDILPSWDWLKAHGLGR